MGCELFLGREAFIISSSQVVSNLGGCHAAASLGEDISPLGSWFSWNQKKFLRALLSYHIWLSLVKGSNLAGDRKANSLNETEQRHKPVSSKKRRLNIFLFKSKFSRGVVNSQGIFLLPWKACLAATPASSTNKRSMYRQMHTGRTCSSGNKQCYLEESWKVH